MSRSSLTSTQTEWIGIFQAGWPLQCHTLNSAIALANHGFSVDIFLYNTPIVADLKEVESIPGIQLHIFGKTNPYSSGTSVSVQKLRNKIYQTFFSLYQRILYSLQNYESFIPKNIQSKINRIIQEKNYKCLIGVEKQGVIWAGQVATQKHCPYLYHSLELYTKNHPHIQSSFHTQRIKQAEEKYHRNTIATIIQDESRAEILLKDNGLDRTKILTLPVSLMGEPKGRSSYLQDKFNLPNDQVTILQFGQITRFGQELCQVAQGFPSEWTLVLHDGLIASFWHLNKVVQSLQLTDEKQKVKLSLDNLNSEQIVDLVASAHIGLVLYPGHYENDYLTVFSSEKIALYLKCGIPVIAFNYPGYGVIEEYRCGALINTLEDLPEAVEKILEDYSNYQTNAYQQFSRFYQFENNFQKVIDFIEAL